MGEDEALQGNRRNEVDKEEEDEEDMREMMRREAEIEAERIFLAELRTIGTAPLPSSFPFNDVTSYLSQTTPSLHLRHKWNERLSDGDVPRGESSSPRWSQMQSQVRSGSGAIYPAINVVLLDHDDHDDD